MILLLLKSSFCYSNHYKAITPIHNDFKKICWSFFNRQINWVMKFSPDGHGAISCAHKYKDFETTENRWIGHSWPNEITATHSCVPGICCCESWWSLWLVRLLHRCFVDKKAKASSIVILPEYSKSCFPCCILFTFGIMLMWKFHSRVSFLSFWITCP